MESKVVTQRSGAGKSNQSERKGFEHGIASKDSEQNCPERPREELRGAECTADVDAYSEAETVVRPPTRR